MNRHMRETFGGDLTGAKCWEAFQDRSGPCETCYSAGIVDERGEATGLLVWEGESPVTGRRYINFDRAIRWIDGRLVRLQIAMDITDLARMQEEKLQLEKQLRQAQKMEAIGTLAGGIAHDFNNILAAVLGYAEIALDECRGQPPLDGYLGEILKASHRAKDLTRQILTFSRQAEIAPKPVRIKSIVHEAVKLLRASLPTTIAIKEDLDCDATVMADPTQLHQVVMNLATNAAHAMEKGGGVLSIALEEASHPSIPPDTEGDGEARGYVRLTIADTGHGIDPSIRERIFDPYFTTKDKGKGTGMGLSVVHGIVKNYGGEIEVDSIIGEGAVFRIMLPLQPLDQIPPDAAPPSAAVSGHERILVVDDEPQIAQVLTLMLESLGYQVTAFTSSREARQALEQRPHDFDLLITDMTMPELTGDELARAVLAKHPDMRIILCTGFNEHMTEDRARRIGIRRLIHKPVLRRTLAEEVRRALED
jgi:signal transduction histidine kinase